MTDRHIGYIVTLESSLREDDAEYIKNAILMIRGVADVEPKVEDFSDVMARAAVRTEFIKKLGTVLHGV